MTLTELGVAMHHTRVENWECDYNQHWNARFYTRAFQTASERSFVHDSRDNPGSLGIAVRHLRFHRELFAAAAVEVRSMRIADGRLKGWTLHILSGEGAMSATAVEKAPEPLAALPEVPAALVADILPRCSGSPDVLWDPTARDALITEGGVVRSAHLDHRGGLLAEELVQRTGAANHHHLDRLGLTPAFTAQTSISRMAVEQIIVPVGTCPPGAFLRVRSRIGRASEKSFCAYQWLETLDGDPIARAYRLILTVDLKRRRAVPLPDFLANLDQWPVVYSPPSYQS